MTRRVLITGGTGGIGKATAIALQDAGFRVAVNYFINDEEARNLTAEYGINTFKWDVRDFYACRDGVKNVEDNFGGSVEVLVNNAGITRDGFLHKQTLQNWEDVIGTNLNSVFNMSHAVIQQMRDNKFGRIVNISSVNANGMAGQTNYSASKAGIVGFTKAAALENAGLGITFNAVAPGYTKTEMVMKIAPDILEKIVSKIPAKRLAEVSEIASIICYLASEEAGYINGAVIDVNGALRT